ncbi:cytochrome P450 [Paenibacillus sp. ISL-20]|uniref:cytochrome P450 n=1 Tax=Paenibacillus sp. ISL-20 TaxID=2819163 RepID=UPI001BEC6704|nr:cytochrome P450 [Paenibacillus sp. ISL-20]MBT2765875.1 cytochrome P450 [Paenibacillus sp. ISL-20]
MEQLKSQLIIDYNSVLFQKNPWPVYQQLRNHDPIHWSEHHRSFFLTKYKHIKQVFLDTENFTTEHPFRTTRHLFGRTILDTDGEAHRNIRPIISDHLRPKAIQKNNLDLLAKDVAKNFVDRITPKQSFDFINEFAYKVPSAIIMEFLGLPASDADEIYRIMRPIIRMMDDLDEDFIEAVSASKDLYAYVENAIQKDSSRGFIAHFMTALENGKWDKDEMIRHVMLILTATETGSRMIGNTMALLLERKEEMKLAMVDKEYLKSVVLESLRFEPSLHSAIRISKRDVLLEDKMVPKGTFLVLLLGSANRDEDIYEHPDQWDPARKEKTNMTFSMGPHTCLGANFGKVMLEETFGCLFSRFHEIELAQAEPPVIQGKQFRGPEKLMLSFS